MKLLIRLSIYCSLFLVFWEYYSLFEHHASGEQASPLLQSRQVMQPADDPIASEVTIQMNRLDNDGAVLPVPVDCSPGDVASGCTDDADRPTPYPYATSLITISIEDDYLIDVVSGEMDPEQGYHRVALQAQAIAARSYVLYHIRTIGVINNSIHYQLFVPYRFDRLGLQRSEQLDNPFPVNANPCTGRVLNSFQTIVCQAVAPRQYITETDSTDAGHAEFSADWRDATVNAGDIRRTVQEPISTGTQSSADLCGVFDRVQTISHGRGMTQWGASRWAFGNRCAFAALGNDPWSVNWSDSWQILVHYYTGIHIRSTADRAILAPSHRWNYLSVIWNTSDGRAPRFPNRNTSYLVTIKVQNTSTFDWVCNGRNYTLRYRWIRPGFADAVGDSVSLCNTLRGDPLTDAQFTIRNIPNWGVGLYRLRFDVYEDDRRNITRFEDKGWSPYDVMLCVECNLRAYLPFIQQGRLPALSIPAQEQDGDGPR